MFQLFSPSGMSSITEGLSINDLPQFFHYIILFIFCFWEDMPYALLILILLFVVFTSTTDLFCSLVDIDLIYFFHILFYVRISPTSL